VAESAIVINRTPLRVIAVRDLKAVHTERVDVRATSHRHVQSENCALGRSTRVTRCHARSAYNKQTWR